MKTEEYYLTATKISTFVQCLRDEERETSTIEKYLRNVRVFAAWLGDRPVTKEAAGLEGVFTGGGLSTMYS